MPQPERVRVWKGELLKTSGGLRLKDLMKNKRGKIVSKRKSQSAKATANNLGDWLRKKGDDFFSKGITKDDAKKGAAPGPKPKKLEVGKPVVVNPPKAPKKKVVVNAPPKIKRSEPIKPGDKVSSKRKSNLSVSNIIPSERPKRVRKKTVQYNASKFG